MKILCIVFITIAFSSQLSAQAGTSVIEDTEQGLVIPDNSGTPVSGSETLSVFTVLRTVLVLALVASAIYGIIFFLKRILKTSVQENPHLKILAGASLTTGRSVHIVSVGTKAWLVGAAESGVSLIAEITDQETVDLMLLDASRRQGETRKALSFSSILHNLGASKEQMDKTPKADTIRKNRKKIGRLL